MSNNAALNTIKSANISQPFEYLGMHNDTDSGPIQVRSIANARKSLNGTGRRHGHKRLRASRQNALVSGGIMVNRRA